MKKLAEIGGYKNAASANTCWYTLRNKLLQQDANKPADTAISLTANEQKLLSIVWQCVEGGFPKVNNKKLAELGNYKNSATANTCWYNLRKKLLSSADGGAASPGGDAAITASGGSTRKKRSAGEIADAGGANGPPTKKKRARKPKAIKQEEGAIATKVGTTVEGAEESEDDLEVMKPKWEIMRDAMAEAEAERRKSASRSPTVKDEPKNESARGDLTEYGDVATHYIEELEGDEGLENTSKGMLTAEASIKGEVAAEDEEVSRKFLEQVAEYSGGEARLFSRALGDHVLLDGS